MPAQAWRPASRAALLSAGGSVDSTLGLELLDSVLAAPAPDPFAGEEVAPAFPAAVAEPAPCEGLPAAERCLGFEAPEATLVTVLVVPPPLPQPARPTGVRSSAASETPRAPVPGSPPSDALERLLT
jgi:hypothetical protein